MIDMVFVEEFVEDDDNMEKGFFSLSRAKSLACLETDLAQLANCV